MILGVLASRLDWGFGNPNKTAALIAMLMLLPWLLPVFSGESRPRLKECLVWVAYLVSTLLGAQLIQTVSRGGINAAAVGLLILCVFARPWKRRHIVGAVVAMVALVIFGLVEDRAIRLNPLYATGDASIGNRLAIWKLLACGDWGIRGPRS
jgi:O-antigen ligase